MAIYTYRNVGTNQIVHVNHPDFDGNPLWELVSGPGGGGGDVTQADLDAVEQDTTGPHGVADFADLVTDDEATAKVAAHSAASDPHGDRAWVSGQKGAASGLATLDSGTKLPHGQLPALAAGDITSGTLAVARLPVGTTAGTVTAGDDPRIAASPGHRLLIFYAPPQVVNGLNTNEAAAAVFAGYDQIVFGAGLANPGDAYYTSTVAIIARIKELNTRAKVYGYVDMGLTAPSVGAMQTTVNQWVTAGADGILFDTVEYAYNVSRATMNTMVNYCHGLNLGTIINGFQPADVMGSAVDPTHNPAGTPSAMDERDYYLMESWVVNDAFYSATDGFAEMADLKAKGDACRAYRDQLGVKLAAVGVVDYSTATAAELDLWWHMHEAACLVWGIDSYGLTPTNYSASGPNVAVVRDFDYWPELDDRFNPATEYSTNAAVTEATQADLGVVLHLDTDTSTYAFTLPKLSYHVLPVGTTAGTVAAGDALATKVAKGDLVYNVKDYGAISGGSTATNGTALTNALAAAVSAGGGVIFVPTGDYNIGATTLTLDADKNITIEGSGYQSSIVRCAGQFLDASNSSDQGRVANLQIVCTTATNTSHCITVDYPRRWAVERCYITGFGGDSIRYQGGLHSRISDNYILARDGSNTNGNAGIHILDSSTVVIATTITTERNYIATGKTYGIRWYKATNSISMNDVIEGVNPGVGLRLDTAQIVVIELYTEAITGNAVELHDSIAPIIGHLFTEPVVTWSGVASGDRRVTRIGRNYVQTGKGLIFGGTTVGNDPTTSPSIRAGSGTPEGAQTAVVGSTWLRTDGGAGTTGYLKETGTGNTGWRALAAGVAPDVQVFTSSGTWTKPAAAQLVEVVLIGGGGGGGSGRRGAAGTVRCGGGGGASGSVTHYTLPASALPGTVAVTVGGGGSGGPAVTTDDTNGSNGVSGGGSQFGNFLKAWHGSNGQGGTALTGTGGVGIGGTSMGGAGASASTVGNAGAAPAFASHAGGCSGGGITNGTPGTPGNGGTSGSTSFTPVTSGAAGVVDTTAPGDGTAAPTGVALISMGAPGGGAASITTNAQAGGAGAIYGGGGAGGGASLNATGNSGAGGAGAPGIAAIYTYF